MKRLIFLLLLLIVPYCSSSTESTPEGKRIGAVCKDGTKSTATGTGACSKHGGVSYWLYE